MVIAEHTARIGERHLDSSFKRLPLRETGLECFRHPFNTARHHLREENKLTEFNPFTPMTSMTKRELIHLKALHFGPFFCW